MSGLRYPDTFLCGAPKCATTTLVEALGHHSDIFVPAIKEPNFFAPGLVGAYDVVVRDAESYLALYARARPDQRRLDASVTYLFWATAVPEIVKHSPAARFICVFRPPLDLFLSWHAHLCRTDIESVSSPEDAWRLVPDRRACRHLPSNLHDRRVLDYEQFCSVGAQCRALLNLVPRDRVLVLTFEEVTQRWFAARRTLLAFLGVPDAPLALGWANAGRVAYWPRLDRLRRRMAHHAGCLKRTFGVSYRFGVIKSIHRATSRPLEKPALSAAFLADFERRIAPDLDLLATLTGVRLPLRSD